MSDDEELMDRFRVASRSCSDIVIGHATRSPAETFDALARACRDLGIDEWDQYGEHGPVEQLEQEITELLGAEAAVFFPSGTMAQQSVLRIWCDRAGTRRIAMPDIGHVLHHEGDGARVLHDFIVEPLTEGPKTATAADLAGITGHLAAVLIELPLREAGGLLPDWDDLVELAEACRVRGTPLHIDGARIWEAAAGFERTPADVAGLADSVYVSLYKGLGGLAGCCVVGDRDVVGEARRWRKRMGGTIYRMTPEAVAALVGLRTELPRMGECLEWARAFVAALPNSMTPSPAVPHTNMFQVFSGGDADAVNERLIADMLATGRRISSPWRPSAEPGRIWTEITAERHSLAHDPASVAADLAEVVLRGDGAQ